MPYHYYLFADNTSSNLSSRVPDVLHNDGSGTLCGALIKFIDCTTADDGASNPNDLALRFGIYNQSSDIFTVPVQMTSAPARVGGITTVYGYAAPYDTTTSSCPPGMEARQNNKATPAAVANSNLNSSLADTYVFQPGSASMLVDQFTGGSCNGTTCTSPNLNRDSVTPSNLQTIAYARPTPNVSTDLYCVIPYGLVSGI